MHRISIQHVNNLHNDWLRNLDFYKQELGILKERLGEVAAKNTGNEVTREVEHYENAFKVQRDNIDRLGHDIRNNVTAISQDLKEFNAGYIDHTLRAQHDDLQQQYAAEERAVNELRHQFYDFASKWI